MENMFFKEENITLRSNLDENNGLTSYLYHASQQNVNAYKAFDEFLSLTKPKRILEIGTGVGGLTVYLKLCCDYLNMDTKIITYDIHRTCSYDELVNNNVDVRTENVFSPSYSMVDQFVIDFIRQDGVTVVLCDGGYKRGEFNLLSDYLKVNDIIMAHDYSPTEEYFNEHVNRKLWNWCEITDSDIEEAVSRNNLKPYMQDVFLDAVWVCKIKQ